MRGQILAALPTDRLYQEVRSEIESGRPLEGQFAGYVLESDGILWHLGRIYVPHVESLRTLIMTEAHRALYSAHPGVKKMHVDLEQLYFWPGMKCDIANYLLRCLEC